MFLYRFSSFEAIFGRTVECSVTPLNSPPVDRPSGALGNSVSRLKGLYEVIAHHMQFDSGLVTPDSSGRFEKVK
jgi:hypothetical protein